MGDYERHHSLVKMQTDILKRAFKTEENLSEMSEEEIDDIVQAIKDVDGIIGQYLIQIKLQAVKEPPSDEILSAVQLLNFMQKFVKYFPDRPEAKDFGRIVQQFSNPETIEYINHLAKSLR